ncbi:hypothetical protein JRY02_23375 [Enterobacter roggenkampii]|nr:hypothetical protein [Enterobacter roggenkampii]
MKISPQLETTPVKELVAAGHALAKELHCAESAALVRNLATALDVQLARANALASLDAKPVGFISGAREPVLYGEHIGIAIGTSLYTAPPAPVVPNKFTIFNATSFVAEYRPLSKEEAALLAWNACRTNILESISQTENGK